MAETAYIAIGSNLGDRAAHVRWAFEALARLPRTRLVAASPVFETEPVGPVPQSKFLNAAAAIETGLSARELLEHLQLLERERGRDRGAGVRWGPRTLDLDLLLYGRSTIDEPGLRVPHARMHERRFVLEPLAAVAPDAVIPTLGLAVSVVLARLGDGRGREPIR